MKYAVVLFGENASLEAGLDYLKRKVVDRLMGIEYSELARPDLNGRI